MKQQVLVQIQPAELVLDLCYEQPQELTELDASDEDEKQARAEFIHEWILQDMFGPLLEIWGREPQVRLQVFSSPGSGTRRISVAVGARARRQAVFNLQRLISQGDLPESCSNPFATADFLATVPGPDRIGARIRSTMRDLQEACLRYDTLATRYPDFEAGLREQILVLYDKLCAQRLIRTVRDIRRRCHPRKVESSSEARKTLTRREIKHSMR